MEIMNLNVCIMLQTPIPRTDNFMMTLKKKKHLAMFLKGSS